MEEEEVEKPVLPLPSPSLWLSKFLTLQADIFYTCLIALLSPFISFLSLFSGSFCPEKTEENVQLAVQAASNFPSKVVRGGSLLLKKVWVGFLAAVYVCIVLTVLLVVSFILAVGVVQFCVEQPVILRERLQFNYPQVHLGFRSWC
jgi:seipin